MPVAAFMATRKGEATAQNKNKQTPEKTRQYTKYIKFANTIHTSQKNSANLAALFDVLLVL